MLMMTAMSTDTPHRCPAEPAAFVADYAAWMWGCGATCIRTQKNVSRMAAALGLDARLNIMPMHVQLAVSQPDGTERVYERPMRCHGINFDLNSRLSRLSWAVADGRMSPEGARHEFDRCIHLPHTKAVRVLLLASLANASFCRLFGGDVASMLIVFVATLAGFRLKQVMLADGRDMRLAVLLAAFFSAAIGAAGHIFGIGATPEIALGTSVLYLIPGVPYINAASDMIDRHYLCAFSRLMDAFVITACITVGLCGGIFLLGLEV